MICPCCAGKGEIEEQAPVHMTPQQFLIYDVIRRSKYGIRSEALVNKVYADRSDGGPYYALGAVRWQIWNLNKKLKSVNQAIRGTSRGQANTYKLEQM